VAPEAGSHSMNQGRLTAFLTLLVGLVWGIAGIAALVTNNVTPLTVITPVMLIVVGFWMAAKRNGEKK
jgi:sulfite exporter TauE/SafE